MKRVLSMILALTLLCSVFALTACGDKATTGPTQGFTGGTGGTDPTTEEPGNPDINDPNAGLDKRRGFEDVDFAGHTFKFESPISVTDGWHDYEVYAEEDGEGILDSAINERNNLLIEHYDCFVEVVDSQLGTLANDFNTNSNNIDLLLSRYNLGSMGTSGRYYDFYTLGIDLEQPWWDGGFIEDYTVDGQIYAMLGAFSLTSFDATWVMFFNKTVKENNDALKAVDFYQLVYDNEWTLDKFFELSKLAYHDNGNQVAEVGTEDVLGLVSSSFGIAGLYFGGDQGYITKTTNKDGSSTFAHSFDDTAAEVADKVMEIYGHTSTALTDYVKVEAQMRSNTVLFSPEVLRKASFYAGKQGESTEAVSIGVLPHPKFTATQNNYKHRVDNHLIFVAVPTTCTDLERIADFLEVYAYHSYYTVYKSYLNLYKYTYTTDADSAEMVDIILQSRSFDMAYLNNWSGIDGEFRSGIEAGRNVISELKGSLGASIVESANTYRDAVASANNK